MVDPASREPGNDFGGRSGHLLDHAATNSGEVQRAAAQDEDGLAAIRPFGKGENNFESVAADDESVDAGHELGVAVRFAAAGRKEIQVTVGTRNETVNAGTDENRGNHGWQ